MATLNRSERAPRNCSAMSRCPVLDIGRKLGDAFDDA